MKSLSTFLSISLTCLLVLGGQALAASGQDLPNRDREIIYNGDDVRISFFYPVFGKSKIDRAVAEWAQGRVQAFKDEISGLSHDQMYELKGTYRIVRASDRVVSVVWDVWYYTGGAHGGLDIVALIYDLQASELIDVEMLFGNMPLALEILSQTSRARLSETLGNMASDDMITPGTAPELENFGNAIPVPNGMRVYFQPYQVAPWAAGVPEVEISLEQLDPAKPFYEYWGK